MSSIYNFEKSQVNTKVLTEDLHKFSDKIESVTIDQEIDEEQNIIHKIKLHTIESLTQTEQDQLAALINQHVHDSSGDIIWEATRGKVKEAMKFGNDLLIDFAAENVIAGYNTAELTSLITNLGGVLVMLQTGSLIMARNALSAMDPIPTVLEQNRIDNYVSRIDHFLATL